MLHLPIDTVPMKSIQISSGQMFFDFVADIYAEVQR